MDDAAAQTLALNVLTLNTHKGFTHFNRRFVLHELREAMRAVSADIVFLQEVLGSHERHARRQGNTWPAAPQYEFLADSVWKDHAYGRNAVYPHGHHGNALLSKYPIARYKNYDISVGEREKRGCLHCVLKVPGREIEIHAICVHLSLLESHRNRQMKLLCQLVHELVPAAAPLIIAGDFNDWRGRAHEQLGGCAGLREAFIECEGRAARTFPARLPLLRLDRIYYRNARIGRAAVHADLPWSHLSDHAALSVEVRL